MTFTQTDINVARRALTQADAVLIGAGSGLSTAAGLTYQGRRFQQHFADFIARYHFSDMYAGGFYPFATPEEYWAYWSRYIFINRYQKAPKPVYQRLRSLVQGKDIFVLTTNVDHQFQLAGFDKQRLFYTQGDYGLFQCSVPCHAHTYDNESTIRAMVAQQTNMRVPTELIPRCPICGAPMTMNLRADSTFVEDAGWQAAYQRYVCFLQRTAKTRIVYLELGVGFNTPGIIRYPFEQFTFQGKHATLIRLNQHEAAVPAALAQKSICLRGDIHRTLRALLSPEEETA